VTDAADGYLARRLGQHTTLGSYIDPIADKLLLVSGFLSLSLLKDLPVSMHIPGWLTLTVLTRDVVIVLGALFIFITTGTLKARPLFIGKLTTVFQMTTLFACLVALPPAVRNASFIITFFLTVVSGIVYQGAVFVLFVTLATRLFSSEAVLTMKLWRPGKHDA
jgi:cardiolipin synthase